MTYDLRSRDHRNPVSNVGKGRLRPDRNDLDRIDFIDGNELIEDVIYKRTWLTKENSNTRISPSLIDMHLASQFKKRYALERLYSPDVTRAHRDGSIHIHDLHDPFKPYCNGIDARLFLRDGLRFSDSTSRPARRLDVAFFHAMSFMLHSQHFFAGAQAIDMFNWMLAPYLHYDDMDDERLLQLVQGFMFQMNQSNRIGAQSAFTNIGLRICCPPYLSNERAIYAGKELENTYSDFEPEARRIYAAFMKVAARGDANELPFTFPLLTTAITKELDPKDPLWELTMKATASTGAPYFLNLTVSYLEEDIVQAMCCRLLAKHTGGVWTAGGMGTGSNKIVSINLPRIALVSKNPEDFFHKLDQVMDISRKALLEGQQIVRSCLYEWDLLPWLLLKTRNGVPYFNLDSRHLTFGVVGLNECLLDLTGEGLVKEQKMGIKIIKYILERIEDYSRKDGIQYTLEQTPAESTAYRFAMIDKKKMGSAAWVQGSEGTFYYTNSTHVPYNSRISLIDRIRIEAAFHPYFTGGAISHIWMGESYPDPGGLSEFIDRIKDSQLAYFCFSPDFSICQNEHTSRGKNKKCPVCGAPIEDYVSRVTGFYGHVKQWNPGKQKEYEDRVRYDPAKD